MRVQPLPADQWDEAVEQALSGMLPPERRNAEGAGNLMSTLARHPKLARSFLRFGGYLLMSSTLPARIREQAILRVAHRRACAYEWTHHVEIAKQAGLSDAEIAAAKTGETHDAFDRAVFTAVDELDEIVQPVRRDLGDPRPSGSTSGSAWTSSSPSAATSDSRWP